MNWIKSIIKTIIKEQFVLLLCLFVYSSNGFSQTTNPAISVADLVSECPDTGKELPKLFLCGSSSSRQITVGSSNVTSVSWEKLDLSLCTFSGEDCPTESNTCYKTVSKTNSFNVSEAGYYKVTIINLNSSPTIFYFNVYQNGLNIPITTKDIYCGKPGEIRMAQLTDYEYSLDGISYQASNVFSISKEGDYTVRVRRKGATSTDCVFEIKVTITNHDLSVIPEITQPVSASGKGTIKLATSNGFGQYSYILKQGATLVNQSGLIEKNDYTFPDLNPGTYTWIVKTDDCEKSGEFTINTIAVLNVSKSVQSVTCEPGSIILDASGGTKPYKYFFNGKTTPEISNIISVPISGTYSVKVVDSSNQTTTVSVVVPEQKAPDFTVEKTNENCYYPNSWQIKFKVSNANGNSLKFSIDNGVTFSGNSTFSNLTAGVYKTIIEYTFGKAKCTKSQEISIVQPQFGLSAVAGISELIGCLPAPNEDKAKVRITNPQGGTPPYQYSFDDQYNWGGEKIAYKIPGKYIFYIKDAAGCISSLPELIVDDIGVPSIIIKPTNFNCDGSATSTVEIVTATSTQFNYNYFLDGLPQTILDLTSVPPGNHTLKVEYTPLLFPDYSNLLKEDFGYGPDIVSPGMGSAYCFERQINPVTCNIGKPGYGIAINDGEYSVTAKMESLQGGAWWNVKDHTNPNLSRGRFLAVNVGAIDPRVVIYQKTINDVIPNQPINVELYATNLLNTSTNTSAMPELVISLIDPTNPNVPISNNFSKSTGRIPSTKGWIKYNITLNPGNRTTLNFIIQSNNANTGGNDLAIDDISAYQIPKLCTNSKTISFTVPSGKAFTASTTASKNISCLGETDGSITIAAQNYDSTKGYEYSIDNGVTWQSEKSSQFTIPNLKKGTYKIKVRYDNLGSCILDLGETTIIEPTQLKTQASIVLAAKCGQGATIEATSTGGTPYYCYEIWDVSNSSSPFRARQNSGLFDNIPPGEYRVRGWDVNNCQSEKEVLLSVSAPQEVQASVNRTKSNLCYDSVNQSSLVVEVSSGTFPFAYRLNGQSEQSSPRFNNIGPGDYVVTVTDSNNCIVNTQRIQIGTEFKVAANMIKALDCTTSPDAAINVTISGGTKALRYKVFKDGKKISENDVAIPETDTSFTYQVKEDQTGIYSFEIIDANGCVKTTHPITIKPKTLPVINSIPQIQSILCHGDSTAAIEVNLDTTKGIAPFTYEVKNKTTNINLGNQFSSLPAGEYEITVIDSRSCKNSKDFEIQSPKQLIVNYTPTPITCNDSGISKGAITIDEVTGGTANFTYFVRGVNNYNEKKENQLGNSAQIFDVIDFGLYEINVVDANGCSVVHPKIVIASPPDDLDINVSLAAVDCSMGGQATVSIGPKSKITTQGPFYFSTYKGFVPNYPTGDWVPEDSAESKKATISNLLPGVKYTFVVYDSSTGCYYYEIAEIAIPTNSTLKIAMVKAQNISCKGSQDGKVSFEVTNNTGNNTPISYQIYNSLSLVPVLNTTGSTTVQANSTQKITDLGSLPFGDYFILITEGSGAINEGCSVASETFSITESAVEFSLTTQVVQTANCNQKGIITAQAKDGTAPYEYLIVKAIPPSGTAIPPPPPSPTGTWVTTNTFNVEEGSYVVFAKDKFGCIQSTNETVDKDSVPKINIHLTQACAAEGNFEIKIEATTPGISPYYLSSNGSVFEPISSLPHTLSKQNSGDYNISIKDVNGCESNQSITIHAPLGLSTKGMVLPSCDSNDGAIELINIGGSGNFEYSVDGVSNTSSLVSGLTSGKHFFAVNDTETNCKKEIEIELEAPTPITEFKVEPTNVSCKDGADGTIRASIATPIAGVNDNPKYSYRLNGGSFQDSAIFYNLKAGNYSVEVVSNRGCIATEKDITISEPKTIEVPSPKVEEFSCNTSNDMQYATIEVINVTGGSSKYVLFEFYKNGVLLQAGPSSTYKESDVLGGNYSINVYDDKGCIGTATARINPFVKLSQLKVEATSTISCTSPENIQVSVETLGGTAINLEYSLVDINPETGIIGGVYPLQTNTSGVFTGLSEGNYSVNVINKNTGCSLQEIYYVNDPNTFDLNIDSILNVSCYGGNDGQAQLTFIDRNSPSRAGAFEYEIRNQSNLIVQQNSTTSFGPIAINGLASGIYAIKATLSNNPFCSVTKNFTISQPTTALSIQGNHTEISCIETLNDGKISAIAEGGWLAYEYQLEKGAVVVVAWSQTSVFSNLSEGEYTIRVRDLNNCEVTKQVVLKQPTAISFKVELDDNIVQCKGSQNRKLTISEVAGGQGKNYQFTLQKTADEPIQFGPQSSNLFEELGAGNYTLTVSDGWNCATSSKNIIISEPETVVANLVLKTPLTCSVQPEIELEVTGGTSPYTYSEEGVVYSASVFSTPQTFSVGVDTHSYYVKDAKGCISKSNAIVIDLLAGLQVEVRNTLAEINCKGDTTATIEAIALGGLGTYRYSLLDEAANEVRKSQPSGIFTNLGAGKYKVKVESTDCSPAESAFITIKEPSEKLTAKFSVTDALCTGSSTGKIKIDINGGTTVVKQAISPNLNQFTETNLFDNLAIGSYDVLVQDALGCYEKQTLTIKEPDPLEIQTVTSSIVQEICFDENNAQFSIVASGGTLPYSVSLDNPSGPFTTGTTAQTQFDFTGLKGGSHTVYVQDANNCTLDWTVNLNESVKLNPTISINYDCVSNAQHNLVTVSLDPSITDFSLVEFALDGDVYQSSNIFSNLTPGDHFIRVKYKNGCIKDSLVFNIKIVEPLTLILKEGGLNEIIAEANGGGGNYTYSFDGKLFETNPSYFYSTTQDYLVTVQDANGCSTSVTQRFDYIDICVPNYFTPNGDGINDTWAPGCTINYKNLTFSVLDRYGREIGNYRLGESWNGKYQGVELPSGDYWFVLQLNNSKDDREFVGHFTLYR